MLSKETPPACCTVPSPSINPASKLRRSVSFAHRYSTGMCLLFSIFRFANLPVRVNAGLHFWCTRVDFVFSPQTSHFPSSYMDCSAGSFIP